MRDARDEFDLPEDLAYLQTGSIGPIPRRVLQAHSARLCRFNAYGGDDEIDVLAAAARIRLAELVGAGPAEIAFTSSTSEGLIHVLASLDLREGDEVITSDLEHAALAAPLAQLAARRGVRVRVIPGMDPAGVAAALGPATRLVAFSHVAYTTGARLPVAEVAALAAAREVPVLVDGAQAAGAVPVDVRALGVDFYAFPGYKWLLGPQGTAALYVSRRHLGPGGREPWLGGCRGMARHDPGTAECLFREDATRFERSTLPFHDFACLAESLDFLRGWGHVTGRVLELAGCLAGGLASIPGVTVLAPARSSGLVSFTLGRDPEAVAEELRLADRVIVRTVPRPRAVRASTHFFNTAEELERLLRGVARLARG